MADADSPSSSSGSGLLSDAGYSSGDHVVLDNVGGNPGNSTSSNSFTVMTFNGGAFEVLSKSSFRYRYIVDLQPDNGTTVTTHPRFLESSINNQDITELEVTATDSRAVVDSGWIDPTTITSDTVVTFGAIRIKVDSGSATIRNLSVLSGIAL